MRKPCNQKKPNDIPEKIVIPLFEIVVYPDSRTKFQVDKATGEILLAAMEDTEAAYAVGLTREERHPAF
ncbi:MAG: hypothetical protein MZV63_46215 [Marinilabiliales bacterium]|nr:hypothetical protein [Marinilabiliales bacterium]